MGFVDDLQGGDVDQHASCLARHDSVGQVVLQPGGKLIVHIDLDGDRRGARLEDCGMVSTGDAWLAISDDSAGCSGLAALPLA
ncbi:MAG: hypothetical protein U1E60_09045 [Reyranellaceae bacterium]